MFQIHAIGDCNSHVKIIQANHLFYQIRLSHIFLYQFPLKLDQVDQEIMRTVLVRKSLMRCLQNLGKVDIA